MRKLVLFLFLFSSQLSYSQWFAQSIPTSKVVNDIYFTDSLNGWLCAGGTAVSDSGIILHTSNGGTNWIKQYGAQSNPLRAIKMVNVNTGYCAGGYRTILKTTNGGNNWNNLSVDFGNYFGDLSAHNDTVYVSDYTMAPCIYRSTNGGGNFSVVYGGTYCEHIFFLNGSTGWAAVGGFFLAKTSNAGNNWSTIQSYSNPIGNISFVNENTGWFVGGDSSGVWKSTNGGINFRQQFLPTGGSGAFSIYIVSNTNGWIGSISFKNYKTTDGINWILKPIPIFSSYHMSFVDSLIGWSASGGVAKTTNGGLTYIGGSPGIMVQGYSLKQNYPNPFNPVTNIQFELIKSGSAELSVFDVSGKELFTLKLNELAQGLHTVSFDGSGLSSGVYFYRINISDNKSNLLFTDSKKMILVK